MSIESNLQQLRSRLPQDVTLVAVSKTKPAELIREAYAAGQRDFGENYIQELVRKAEELPKDIRWHFIGHLQSNKVKYIAPFIHLIHGVDSLKLLKEINKQGEKNNRVLSCLLQVHIAREETKFGLSEEELHAIINDPDLNSLHHTRIVGLMGMASFTDHEETVRNEFRFLARLFNKLKSFSSHNIEMSVLSMGMSGDYHLAAEEGSTLVRIGSAIFGSR